MKNIAVFFGGQSVEHDISVITGTLTVNTLDKIEYNAVPVYIGRDGAWFTGDALKDISFYKRFDAKKLTRVTLADGNTLFAVKKNKLKPLLNIAVAINCMHGERGEDGSLSGVLSMYGVPLASPDITASAVCIDKAVAKAFARGIGIPVVKGVCVKGAVDIGKIEKLLSYPVIVKPCRLGSSIGVSVAGNKAELKRAVDFAYRFGDKAVVEEKLLNMTEINCACFLNESGKVVVSECERPVSAGSFLSFDEKYTAGKRQFPADIDIKYSRRIKRYTEKIYRSLDCRGVIRVDYFLCNGKVYMNEINTVPGSLAFYLFGNDLESFSSLLDTLIKRAVKDYATVTTFCRQFPSGVLDLKGAKGVKRL